eukprot:CAMPEP_0170761004 /NCGR_PEP_ID=MMETSP0733-20121128/1908_1 /TAXON_ID=186038 /ORGANISM="Fragilariopsis kerguelensis, Strain L26-C5" /LENGTH=266 /DNA_ID=CAMNT_0011100895 /DNA_START=181 /DNA_END=977 /DNA_ORIENTATION=-
MSDISLSPGSLLAERQTKKRRIMDVGGPIEDTNTAIQKLTNAKFNLERYYKDINDEHNLEDYSNLWVEISPMIYFCCEGDLKMCRYLFVNGADCRKGSDDGLWFPMLAAASRQHLHVCKWLYEHGARDDIRRATNIGERTPLYESVNFSFGASTSTSQWLILNGALCQKDSDTIDDTLMRRDLNPNDKGGPDKRLQLLLWAQETAQLHSTFLIFLGGTISASVQESSPLQIFNGKSGIMELIGDYAGVERRASKLRMLQQLADLLS